MKHIILICLIFTGSYFNQAFAQELECGAIQTQANKDFLAKTKEFRNSLNFDNLRAVPHVLPIVAHVIVQDKNNLSGEFSEAEVEQSIAQLNAIFATPPSNSDGEAGSGISFIRCGEINYISETQDYPPDPSNDIDIYPKLHKGDEVKMLSRDFHAAGAINIFYAKELFSGESSICGTATYPGTNSTNLDRIFIANECALNKSTLAHEVGHYLNVLHTYNGNTEEEEDETPELVERPPDGDDFCVPATTTCNCGGDDVGDELCDTPADPHKLEFVIDGETVEYNIRDCSSHELDTPACTFSDSDVAAGCNQEDYMPDHKNIMSANWKECRETFTQGQIDRMLAALQTPARSALLTNTCDCLNSISFSSNHKHKSITYTVKDTINSSANIPGDDNPPVSNVVYNAGKYVVMCPPFLAEYGCTFLSYIEGCDPNATNLKNSATGSVNLLLSNVQVYPNPFTDYADMEFKLEQDSHLTAVLFDMVGNQIETLVNSKKYKAGKHSIPINGSKLPAGIYYCTIQAGNHIETQKMVLTK